MKMRIVAGTLRGRPIEAPEGRDTRPTTDRVREALFSSLFSMRGGWEGAVVLDAFAGSGALGLEALSRGAQRAVFYDSDQRAVSVLRANIASCHMQASAEVHQADVLKSPPAVAATPYHVVFLDPPYATDAEAVLSLAAGLGRRGCLDAGALIVYEHALDAAARIDDLAGGFGLAVRKFKKYGKTGVTTLVLESAAHE